MLALTVGSVALLGGALLWASRSEDRPPPVPVGSGQILCPGQLGLPPPIVKPDRGDFVVIMLSSADGSVRERTWARVRSRRGDRIFAEITGELTETGIRPLRTSEHGFPIGHKMFLDVDCVLEVLTVEKSFQILCGPGLTAVEGGLLIPVDTTGLAVGDRARIVIASREAQGTAWHEVLWTKVESVHGDVVEGRIDEHAVRPEHKLLLGSAVEFTRDCVVAIQKAG